MDPLYESERASRKRVWDSLVKIDKEARRNRTTPVPEGLRSPFPILMVTDYDGINNRDILELCYT